MTRLPRSRPHGGPVHVAVALVASLAVLAGAALTGCTATATDPGRGGGPPAAGSFRLVAFDSCDEAITGLRTAAKAVVGPYGFGGPVFMEGDALANGGAPPPAPVQQRGSAGEKSLGDTAGAPGYSGTNTHEAGVDEPDMVKTDGRRIVTVTGGVLRVVDAASRSVTGFVDLVDGDDQNSRMADGDILLAGDHALILMQQSYMFRGGPVVMEDSSGRVAPQRDVSGPRLLLVDLAGQPRVLSSMVVDGALVDARQVASTARVVIRSAPRINFPALQNTTDKERIKAQKSIIEHAPLDLWLPRIEVTTDGATRTSSVPCDAISRPASYSGTNLLTILTIDLGASDLGDGQPVTLAADGDTVYSNGPALYIASNQMWRLRPGGEVKPDDARTEIYKFDTSTPQRPRYVAGGGVPGFLINQYAMSEFDGNLRVATTTGQWSGQGRTQSSVYVLAQRDASLRQIGHVGGLGKSERIYAVRFIGPVGYVVTFRQTDPLYTVDLRDPTKPKVTGELKIPGYSAYLHPVGSDRLIGVGQDATSEGRVKGTQVSLFDVGDLSNPRRITQYSLQGSHSEAEFDPHAFLYWPATGLLVVPLQVYRTFDTPNGTDPAIKAMPSVGALVLRVSDRSISEMSFLTHPAGRQTYAAYSPGIRRSLVIGDTLWTVSQGGLMATDMNSLIRQTWIAYE
jgi:hypothetical protein